MFECRLFGNVEVRVDGRPVDIGPAKQRCVLATLLVEANRTVSADQLIDRVWADRAPLRVRSSLHSLLTRLRSALAAAPMSITSRSGAYVLDVDEHAVDLHRFRHLMKRSRAEADDGRALDLAEQAMALWRGEPFAGLDTPWLAELRAALERERATSRVDYHDLALRCGKHAELLTDLSTMADEDPLDERVAGQLMIALYRAGRQADAHAHYARTRKLLAESLGADPGPALQALHRGILSGSAALASDETAPAMFSLRADIPGFVGRDDELRDLTEAVNASPTVVIRALDGMAGIGKTALAVRAAHLLAARFPDGNVFVEFHGHTPGRTRVSTGEALDSLLRATGIDPKTIPPRLDDRARLWRNRVAGKKILLVLDDVVDHDQVRTLLPGTAGSLVLITSRNRLPALDGVRSVSLDVLPAEQALHLLRESAGTDQHDDEALAEIVMCCGRLPLALALAGAQLRDHPQWNARYLANLLTEEYDRIEHLSAGDRSIAAAFTMSYRHLPAAEQHLFRLLGLHPGPSIDVFATAALSGHTFQETRRQLETLRTRHLIEETKAGRYRLHRLVRAYARALGTAGDAPHHAVEQVLIYYRHTAHTANIHLPGQNSCTAPVVVTVPHVAPYIGNEHAARTWFTAELATLVTCIDQYRTGPHRSHVADLSARLNPFLELSGYLDQALTVHLAALSAAGPADPLGQATAHTDIGIVCQLRGEPAAAAEHFGQALKLFVELGDRDGEAKALGHLRELNG
ncbi:BTAD domain-containing putative transcriptional regulator [Lentzea sp. NPDC051838]|uniref:AfsR/SARP family transcriptional regulator n=1 Tax=Lentzea sp. NPDC051838 TaxID=3154849 RepID=UPI00343F5A6D